MKRLSNNAKIFKIWYVGGTVISNKIMKSVR